MLSADLRSLDAGRRARAPSSSSSAFLQGGPLFPNPRTGNAWSTTGFRRTWEKACQAAGLPILNPYETLRHSTATEWVRRGASEREVQELLGHRTRHATSRYARLADERLESIVGYRRPMTDMARSPHPTSAAVVGSGTTLRNALPKEVG